MLKKIFGANDPLPLPRPPRMQLERILAQIALEAPEFSWIALVESNGIFAGSFPTKLELKEDRIVAMSAAILSLGERIARELNDGELNYALIAGAEAMTLVVVVSQQYLLTVGLSRDIPIEKVFDKLRYALPPLLTFLYNNRPVPL